MGFHAVTDEEVISVAQKLGVGRVLRKPNLGLVFDDDDRDAIVYHYTDNT